MIPTKRFWFNTLQVGLLVSAVGWGIALFFTFAPWDKAANQLEDMGSGPIPYHPLADYWLKMASSVFGCIGVASAIACVRPRVFSSFIHLLGPFHFIIGTTLAISAYQNGLTRELHPSFIPDIVFCFLAGTLIQIPLLFGRETSPPNQGTQAAEVR
jgi:hypothetical protein